MTPSSDSTTTASKAAGDPAKCARRVTSIESVVQTVGRFRLDQEQSSERLFVLMPESVAKGTLEGDKIIVLLSFAFSAVPANEQELPEPGATPIVEVDATYAVTYRIRGDEPVSDADVAAFADINGRLNLTPYWREYLANCLARADMPTYPIPPFNAAARIDAMRRAAAEAAPET